MKRVKIIIEKTDDAYWAYAVNLVGVSGVGDSPQEAKESALNCIKIQITEGNIPDAQYTPVFKFDAQSLLVYYKKIINYAALEKMTGINQKQIQHYAAGHKMPRQAQIKKIESAFKSLGRELISLELS